MEDPRLLVAGPPNLLIDLHESELKPIMLRYDKRRGGGRPIELFDRVAEGQIQADYRLGSRGCNSTGGFFGLEPL